MPCYEPLYGRLHVTPNGIRGRATFFPTDSSDFYINGKFPIDLVVSGRPAEKLQSVPFPCRKCFGCKKERARQWSIRCEHERLKHKRSCFVTLTMSDDFIKDRGHRSVDRRDVQLFMKRLRKYFTGIKIRMFYVSEYGVLNFRPHYHLLLFGVDFEEDRFFYKNTDAKSTLYRSHVLEKLWPYGYSSIGEVTPKSAAYVAQYTLKKLSVAKLSTLCLQPEFQQASNRPGLGKDWFVENWKEVVSSDSVVCDKYEQKPPTYYDKLLKEISLPIYNENKAKRLKKAQECKENSTYSRLKVRLQVNVAKSSLFARGRFDVN